MNRRVHRAAAAACLAVLAVAAPARAQSTVTWSATGTNTAIGGTGTWDTTNALWTANGTTWSPWNNAANDTAVFAGTAGTVTLSTGITVGGLTFNTPDYTLTADTLTLAGATANVTVASGSATIGSTLAGSAVLAKLGAGTLVLSASNTFTGSTSINAGTLLVGNADALRNSAGVNVASGGTLDLGSLAATIGSLTGSGTITGASGSGLTVTQSGSSTFSGRVTGTMGFTKNGAGRLTLSTTNNFVGTINVNSGTLAATAATGASSLSALGAAGNTINVASGATLLFDGANRAAGSHTGVVNINGGTITFNTTDNILGSGTTITFGTSAGTVNGTGQWRINNVTGTAARVVVDANASGSVITTATVSLGTTVGNYIFQVADGANATDLAISSVIEGANAAGINFVKTGDGSLLLSGTNTFNPVRVRVSAGALIAGSDAPASGNGAFGSSASGTIRLADGSTLAGDAPTLLIGGTFNVGRPVIVGGDSNTAAYNATLGGTNTSGTATFSGLVTLNNTAGAIWTLSLLAAPGGTVSFPNFDFRRGLAVTVGSAGNTGTVLVGGSIGSASNLTMADGTLVLSGSNGYSGNTTVRSGTVIVGINAPSGAAGAFGSSGNAVILGDGSTGASTSPTILIGGTFTVGRTITVGSVANTNVYSPILGGTNTSGTSTFSGGITLNTTAANYTGVTLQAAPGGTVNFTGAVNTNGKAVTVGSAGNTGTVIVGNTISGASGSITMTNGTLLLSGANTYTGATTIRSGTLVAGANAPSGGNGAFGNASSALVLGDGSTAASDAPAILVGGAFTVGRSITVGSVSNANAYSPILGGTNTSGTATFSGAVTLNTTAANYTGITLVAAPGGTVNFTGAWTTNNKPVTIGSAGNTGTVRLTGTLTTTGTVTVNNGTLTLGSGSSIGAGSQMSPLTINTGTVEIATNVNNTFGASGGTAAITINSGGVLLANNASNNSTTLGPLTLNGGRLDSNAVSASGSATFALQGVTVGGSQLSTISALSISSSGTFTVGDVTAGTDLLVSSTISGTNPLRKAGAGTMAVTGLNTYSGTTFITAGALVAGGNAPSGSAGALGNASSAIVLGTDLTAAGDAPALLIGGAFDVGRAVSVGSLTNSNAYSPVLGGTNTSGTATFSGGITLNTTASAYTGITLVAAPGGTVNFTGAWTTNDKPVTIGSGGNTGTVRLGSTLATTGTLTVANGTLLAGLADAIGNTTPVSMAGGTLDLAGFADTIGSLSGASGTITGAAGSALTVTQASSGTYGGVVAGSVALTKAGAGTLALTAANTYTGDTTISTGTLQVGGAGQLGSGVYGGAISNAGTLDYASSANQTLSGSITGNGSLLKSGAGTLTLSGSNSYSGGTQVTGGTLAFANGGLGSSGSVTLANSTALQWASGNTQDISSRLVLPGSGAATLDVGANNVTLASNFGGGSAAGIVKSGGGTLSLTSVQDFTGDVRVAAGILQVSGTSILQLADGLYVDSGASLVGQNGITVFSGQTLGGYGNVDPGAGSIVFNPGGILSPGGSVGELDGLGSATFNGGMQYLFEVNDANGTPGVSPGWDLFSTTGAVGFANTGTPIIVDLTSLAGTVSGSAANFNPAFNYAWKFVVAGSEIGYSRATNPGWFTVQTTNFTNAFDGGFYVARGDQMQAVNASGSSSELYVVYAAVPEPSTLALAGIGLAAAGWAAARRRRRAA